MIKYVQSVCTYCISVYGGDTYTVFGSKPEQTFNMMHVDAENKNMTCIKQSFLKIVNGLFSDGTPMHFKFSVVCLL